MITLFKTDNCQACKALQTEMTNRGIAFKVETSPEVAASLGIRSAPALIKADGSVLRSSAEIVKFLKAA